jgi:hypothetical protein
MAVVQALSQGMTNEYLIRDAARDRDERVQEIIDVALEFAAS